MLPCSTVIRYRVLDLVVTVLVVSKPHALLEHNSKHHPAVEVHLGLRQERQEEVLDDAHRAHPVVVVVTASVVPVATSDGEGDALAVAAAAAGAVATVRITGVDFEAASVFVRVRGL